MCFDIWAIKTKLLLANYVPKCQMTSGPNGSIFNKLNNKIYVVPKDGRWNGIRKTAFLNVQRRGRGVVNRIECVKREIHS